MGGISFGIADQPVNEKRVLCDDDKGFQNEDHTKRKLHFLEALSDGREVVHFHREDGTPDQMLTKPKNGVPDVLGGNCFNALLNIMRVAYAIQAEVKAVIVSSHDSKNGLHHAVETMRERLKFSVIRICTDLIARPSRHVGGFKSTMLFGREHMSQEAMVPIIKEVESVFHNVNRVLVPFHFPEFEFKQDIFATSDAVRGGNLQAMLEDNDGKIPDNVCLYLNDEELTKIEGPNLQELEGQELLEACRELSEGRVDSDEFEMPIHLGRRKGGTAAYFAGKGKEYLVETSGEILDLQEEIIEKFGGEMVHNKGIEDKSTAGRGDAKPSWILALLSSRPDPENFTEEELMSAVLGGDLSAMLIHHSEDSNLLYFDEEHGADIPGLVRYANEMLTGIREKGWIKITKGHQD